MSKYTCDNCPWAQSGCEYGRPGDGNKFITADEDGKTLECPSRKAYRVVRDEVRRLRVRERGLNRFTHKLMEEIDELRGLPKYDASAKNGPLGVVEEREITLDKLPGKPKATISFVRPPKKS
ncbi:MAG: hypothetical protein ACXABY_07880 [Candidatus Thorarchaeota archaeon]|jgi:hypothetical protein